MRRISLLALWALLLNTNHVAMAQELDSSSIANPANQWNMGLGGAASEVADQIQWFHNWILLPVAVFISVFVLALLLIVMFRFSEKKNPVPSKISHNTALEVMWTAVPLLILGLMFIPSIKILYFMESNGPSDITVKVTGQQWFWSYEYTDVKNYGAPPPKYDSIMVAEKDLPDSEKNLYRLKVDNALYIPVNKRVKIILTSQDVSHSFSVLQLGLKMDAIPGRNNETWVTATKPGVYYGFCTELCGAGHAFMPIEIHAVDDGEFQGWLNTLGKGATPAVDATKKTS